VKKYLEILKECPLFRDVSEDSLTVMLHCLGARVESFDKKYTVFAQGAPARYIGIVLSGSVQIVQNDYYGNRSILSHVSPPQVFSEAFACAGLSSLPVSVVANEWSEVMLIDCSYILHTCEKHCVHHQKLIYNLMKDLAEKTVHFHQKMEITSKRSTREKLMAYLNAMARDRGSDRFEIPFDRQELADYLEVDRSGLSVEIGKLKREGVIRCEKNRFELL